MILFFFISFMKMTANNCIVNVFPDRVEKTFKGRSVRKYLNEKKFYVEYSHLLGFVPDLISYDDDEMKLTITNVGECLTRKHYRKNKKIYKQYNREINLMCRWLKKSKIYHNDVRYKNVCIDEDDNLYLIDFEMFSDICLDRDDDCILSNDYRIFVVNAYDDRTLKYLDDPRYEIFPAVWWENINDDTLSKYHFRYNCGEDLRKKICACSCSHLKILEKIRDEKINNAIIIEDDAFIDFDRLKELDNINEPCYIGGMMFPPVLKDVNSFEKPESIDGLNTIDPSKFVILAAHGYYIPNYQDTEIFLEQHYEKRRAIDVEYKHQQKKGKLKKYLYPAISTLNLHDAKKGFTFSSDSYKLKNNYSCY